MLSAQHVQGVLTRPERQAYSRFVTTRKNPHAVALGRRGAEARLRTQTPEQRRVIARTAARARWARRDKRRYPAR